MKHRRLVTGHDPDGSANFISDGPAPRVHDFVHVPGFSSQLMWATEATAPSTRDGADPTQAIESFLPGPGSTRFVIVSFPPDSVYADPAFDPVAAGREHLAVSPGLAETFEPDDPAMHTTPTIDYGIVLEGEIWLELDHGRERHLARGDVIVQNGTRHAWRNRSTQVTTMAFVLVGA